jgi:hypothetical protein
LAIADINKDIIRFLCTSKDLFTILKQSTYLKGLKYPLSLDLLRGDPNSLLRVYNTTSLSEPPLDSIEAVIALFLDSTRERIYKRQRDSACINNRPCANKRPRVSKGDRASTRDPCRQEYKTARQQERTT